jgi:hypothetical protein
MYSASSVPELESSVSSSSSSSLELVASGVELTTFFGIGGTISVRLACDEEYDVDGRAGSLEAADGEVGFLLGVDVVVVDDLALVFGAGSLSESEDESDEELSDADSSSSARLLCVGALLTLFLGDVMAGTAAGDDDEAVVEVGRLSSLKAVAQLPENTPLCLFFNLSSVSFNLASRASSSALRLCRSACFLSILMVRSARELSIMNRLSRSAEKLMAMMLVKNAKKAIVS